MRDQALFIRAYKLEEPHLWLAETTEYQLSASGTDEVDAVKKLLLHIVKRVVVAREIGIDPFQGIERE